MQKLPVLGFIALVAIYVVGCGHVEGRGGGSPAAIAPFSTTNGTEAMPASSNVNLPERTGDATPLANGSTAPDIKVSIDGKLTKLSSFKGHPVMLDFWATWCGPCVASLPHTQKVYDAGKVAGLQVIAISDEDVQTVSKFIREKNYTFPVGLDSTGDSANAFKVEGIPNFVIIDENGKIVDQILGGGQDEEVNKALAKVGVKVQ